MTTTGPPFEEAKKESLTKEPARLALGHLAPSGWPASPSLSPRRPQPRKEAGEHPPRSSENQSPGPGRRVRKNFWNGRPGMWAAPRIGPAEEVLPGYIPSCQGSPRGPRVESHSCWHVGGPSIQSCFPRAVRPEARRPLLRFPAPPPRRPGRPTGLPWAA